MFKPCAVIPVYDHENTVTKVVNGVVAHHLRCLLVDDGSSPRCAQVLDRLAAAYAKEVILVRYQLNCGKGAAVLSGMRQAAQLGYSHALQIDADAQHRTDDIPRFLEEARLHPEALIVGCAVQDDTVPWLRLCAPQGTR